jgi:SAM-dependent methyltransferase
MNTLDRNSLAVMEFELNWQSPEARHCELYFAPNVNMWRDIFTPDVTEALIGCRKNDTLVFSYKPGELVPAYSSRQVLDLSLGQIRNIQVSGHKLTPCFGRFYPLGILQNVPGVFPQTLKPFRVLGIDDARITIDMNHPLCRYEIELTIRVHSIRQSISERGGRCIDWLEEATQNGPGMQARSEGKKTVYENSFSYQRVDANDDSRFYIPPRLTGHIDQQASGLLQGIYTGFLTRNDRVLDLMSSVQSHLPDTYNLSVTGLGLNKLELIKNSLLRDHLVYDLNASGQLPFNNNTFDVVVCSLSIEYLTRPREIITEISRILLPGGRVIFGFSNRWFPPKVTQLWRELHEFERLGLVLDYLIDNGSFSDLCTYSARNWPRPSTDRYAGEILTSDPVFVVAGTKKPE